LKEFLGCYMKPEIISSATSSRKLQKLDITSKDNYLKQESMFIGSRARRVIEKSSAKDHVVKDFLKQVCICV